MPWNRDSRRRWAGCGSCRAGFLSARRSRTGQVADVQLDDLVTLVLHLLRLLPARGRGCRNRRWRACRTCGWVAVPLSVSWLVGFSVGGRASKHAVWRGGSWKLGSAGISTTAQSYNVPKPPGPANLPSARPSAVQPARSATMKLHLDKSDSTTPSPATTPPRTGAPRHGNRDRDAQPHRRRLAPPAASTPSTRPPSPALAGLGCEILILGTGMRQRPSQADARLIEPPASASR